MSVTRHLNTVHVHVLRLQHTDMTFRPCPPLGSILHGMVIPTEPNEYGNKAGDTEFFSMSAAYEALDSDLKVRYVYAVVGPSDLVTDCIDALSLRLQIGESLG